MKAIHNNLYNILRQSKVVVNIVKSKNESNSNVLNHKIIPNLILAKNKKSSIQRLSFFVCGVGGIRTLVQTQYDLRFLHAQLLFNCREREGESLTYTVLRICWISSLLSNIAVTSSIIRCLWCQTIEQGLTRQKLFLILN